MPFIASDVGTIAANAVAEILGRAGEDVGAQLDASPRVTRTLVEGGWTALTAAESDAGLVLRDIQEVARVCGRHLVPHALTTTLLAGRWFGLGESELSGGVSFAVPRGDTAVLPYAVDTARVVSADGRDLGPLPGGPFDDFAVVMPLAAQASAASPLDDARRAELAAVLAATATGCADTALAWSVAWVQTREQFRQPIKHFQAVRHHLADMHIAREEAWTCAVAAAHEPADAIGWAGTGTDRARTAIELGIQVHGGVGFTWEAGIHHLLKHVLQLETLLGEPS